MANEYTYGTPVENTTLPEYQPPDMQWIIDALMGLTGGDYGVDAPNYLNRVTDMFGFGPNQLGDWFTKMFSGRRAGRIGEEYETAATGKLNRAAPTIWKQGVGAVNEGGGRGSSEMARTKADLIDRYYNELDDISLNRIGLEEQIRGQDFARGQYGMGAMTGLMQGDYNAALQNALMAMQSTGMDADIFGTIGNYEMGGNQMENAFNWALYNAFTGGGDGANLWDLIGSGLGLFGGALAGGYV